MHFVKAGIKTLVVVFFLAVLVGCSVKEINKDASDEQALTERVTMFWNHNVKEEYDKSYEFEYPLYRKNVSLMNYIKGIRGNVRWTKASIKSIDINKNNNTASVSLLVDTMISDVPVPARAKRLEFEVKNNEIQEQWQKIDGVWYHVPFRAGGDKGKAVTGG